MIRWLLPLLLSGCAVAAPPTFDNLKDLVRRGQFAEALAVAESILKVEPRDARVWTLKGIALQSLARPADGLAALRRALTIRPAFLPALQAAAQLEYQTGDPAARTTLEHLVALRPDPAASAMLGVLAFERKDCGESIRRFAEASAAIANQPLARRQFATCLFETRQYERAAGEFTALLAQKDDPQLRYNLGLARYRAQQFRDAVAALEPLARDPSADADALSLLASAYEANKKTPAAVATLRGALDRFPRDERLYIDLAGLCLEHHSIPLAVEVMEIGVRNLPTSPRVRTVMGLVYVRAGSSDKAAEEYRIAASLAPDAGFGAVAQGLLLLQLGAADEAVKLLRGQRARATNEKIDIALAQALLQSGAGEAELLEAERLLAPLRETSDARVYTLRAKIFLQRNDLPRAAKSLESALALDPNDRTAAYQLMTTYRKLGRAAEAARLQTRVRELLEAEKQSESDAGQYRIVAAPERDRDQR